MTELRERVHQIVALCANASGWIAGTAEEKQAVLDGLIEEATTDILNLIGGDGWWPIETAPKDGYFLARNAKGDVRRCWRHNPSSRTDEILSTPRNGKFAATHWMKVPPPPPASS